MADQPLDSIVHAVIDLFKSRAAFGIGTDLDRTNLKPLDWIQQSSWTASSIYRNSRHIQILFRRCRCSGFLHKKKSSRNLYKGMDARPIYRWTKINLSFHSHTGSQAVGRATIRGLNNSEMLHMNLVKNIPQFHKGLADPFFRVHLSSNISCKISISSLPVNISRA